MSALDKVEELRSLEKDVMFVLVVGDRCRMNHNVISIFNGWVYDANMTHAIPYTRESLDHVTRCVGPGESGMGEEEERTNTYTGVVSGFAFCETCSSERKNFMRSNAEGKEVNGTGMAPRLDISDKRRKTLSERRERRKKRKRGAKQRKSEEKAAESNEPQGEEEEPMHVNEDMESEDNE